jgi:hypothetical protein
MRTVRATGLAVLAAGMTLLPMGAATAATSTFEDQVNETTSPSDIHWVKVRNDRQADRFRVAVRADRIVLGSSLTVFVDRNLRNRGPELRMVAVPDSEWALYRVDKWGERGRPLTTCGRVRMSASGAREVAVWRASRDCLHLHGAVRVSARTVDAEGRADWAPQRRHFSPRVPARS